jgi:hypothetical protein
MAMKTKKLKKAKAVKSVATTEVAEQAQVWFNVPNECLLTIEDRLVSNLEDARKGGEALNEAYEKCREHHGYGHWTECVAKEFRGSYETATVWRSIASHWYLVEDCDTIEQARDLIAQHRRTSRTTIANDNGQEVAERVTRSRSPESVDVVDEVVEVSDNDADQASPVGHIDVEPVAEAARPSELVLRLVFTDADVFLHVTELLEQAKAALGLNDDVLTLIEALKRCASAD